MGTGRTARHVENFNKNWQRVERGGPKIWVIWKGGWYLGGVLLEMGGSDPS